MNETDAVLVPTRTVVESLRGDPALPAYAVPKIRDVAERHRSAVALAHQRGVTIAMGTDITLSSRGPLNSWGHNGHELHLMVQAGLSPHEAIRTATANGPTTLGPQAPRSGQLANGYDADVITVDANPLEDISVLAEPARITQVWKSGTRSKARSHLS